MSKYKLLVLDVDGTLVKDNSQNISQNVVDSIKKSKNNLQIILCTGRSIEDLNKIIESLNLVDSYHIVESGAKVLSPGLITEFVRSISIDEVKTLVDEFKSIYDDYGICVDGNWRERLDSVKDGENITTLTFYIEDDTRSDAVMHALNKYSEKYHIDLTSHWNNPNGRQVLITNPQASKEKSLEYVQRKLGISIEETVCIGDMPNDLPMFKRAGFKICMGNGDQRLKDAADIVVKSIDEDGVVEAIENYILN